MNRTNAATLALLLALPACSGDNNSTGDSAGTGTGTDGGQTTTGVTTQNPTQNPTQDPSSATTGDSATGDTPTTGAPDTTTGDHETGHGSTGHISGAESTTGEPIVPTCDDALLNQDETDVDCGGATCGPCADGLNCGVDSDCEINSCVLGVCAAPSCSDGVLNQDETDADCGGPTCDPCMDNLICADPSDCQSGVCTDGLCTPPACGDGVKNGEESDLDCGGSICDGCLGDLVCNTNDDCLSETCNDGKCAPVDCLGDSDCDALDTDCTSGVCKKPGFVCEAVPVNDTKPCAGADLCVTGTTCTAGVCGGGAPKDCSAMSDACHVGTCDPQNGMCGKAPLPDGTKCEDGNACTKLEVCKNAVCGGSTAPLFSEAFANNAAGWTLDTQWAIGPTAPSNCGGGSDPALDHTPTPDNGVAGVVLGGCIPDNTVHDYYCLTSPIVDTTVAPADVHLSYWRWLNSDYTPYMKNKIEVFNGNNWVILFETAGAPGIADAAWQFFTYDVSAHKNNKFQARWCFNVGSTGVFIRSSWNVDDVTLGANACMQ